MSYGRLGMISLPLTCSLERRVIAERGSPSAFYFCFHKTMVYVSFENVNLIGYSMSGC